MKSIWCHTTNPLILSATLSTKIQSNLSRYHTVESPLTMMPAFPSTSGPAVICVGAATPKNPSCCLSCQAWKIGMAPIIALTVCMRERNGGVNGAEVIIKLHKIKLLFSLVNPQYNVVLPCWPSSCPLLVVSMGK